MSTSVLYPAARRLAGVFVVCALAAACSQKARFSGIAGGSGAEEDRTAAAAVAPPGTPKEFTTTVGDRVFFTTDSTDLTPEAKSTLRGQADWLNRYPTFTVTIEGHADERGTREYNIALGARRAEATRSYLTTLGVNPRRMRTISYGKERPVAVCDDISCWSQNRRAVTVLNTRAGS